MPIRIYSLDNISEELAYLSENDWDLSTQIHVLELWVQESMNILHKGNYVADIGFFIRPDASGGGAVLDSGLMKNLGEIGISIYFSEYYEKSKSGT